MFLADVDFLSFKGVQLVSLKFKVGVFGSLKETVCSLLPPDKVDEMEFSIYSLF